MEATTLPKNITSNINKMTKKPWTSIEQADAAADLVRELRFEANELAELTPDEIEFKQRIDAKLAAKANAMRVADEALTVLTPYFIKFTQEQTKKTNATLPVSKHRKYLEGKGWKVQLKDKPGMVAVTDKDDAIAWLEDNEPQAVIVQKSIDMSAVGKTDCLDKLKKLGKKIAMFGFNIVDAIPDGNTTVKVKDFDSQ